LNWLLAPVVTVSVYFPPGVRFLIGSKVTVLEYTSHEYVPAIDGDEDIAASVVDLFMTSEKPIAMLASSETLFVLLAGLVLMTKGLIAVVNENT
jgi:hypothetical protein